MSFFDWIENRVNQVVSGEKPLSDEEREDIEGSDVEQKNLDDERNDHVQAET
jgi:hypothetical protein